MSRWLVNPVELVRNVRQAVRIVPTMRDRWSYLAWLYHGKAFVRRNAAGRRQLAFSLAPPVGNLNLVVRDNRGADQLVFGEVLIWQDYGADLPAPQSVLDLGGNIGLATIYFSRRWPTARLAVVEPVPTNLEILRQNLQLNDVTATVLDAAVGVVDGAATIALANLDCAHRIVDTPTTNSIQVDALSIPTIMSRLGWPRIGLLKMDIEGYESVLFRSNPEWLHKVDSALIEAYNSDIGDEELAGIGRRYGFHTAMTPRGIHAWTRPLPA